MEIRLKKRLNEKPSSGSNIELLNHFRLVSKRLLLSKPCPLFASEMKSRQISSVTVLIRGVMTAAMMKQAKIDAHIFQLYAGIPMILPTHLAHLTQRLGNATAR